MLLFALSLPLISLLPIPTSFARPSDIRLRSLPQVSAAILPQLNLTNPNQDHPSYPVYPTTCFAPSPRSGSRHLPDPKDVLEDCFFMINNVMLRLDDLLFQDLLFSYSSFGDQKGETYVSRWSHGHCVINVAAAERRERQTLQLFNVVLSANKILKECVSQQNNAQGGTSTIGISTGSFYVAVIGYKESNIANSSGPRYTPLLPLSVVRPRTIPSTDSLSLGHELLWGAVSQPNVTSLFQNYPVYPAKCYSPRPIFVLDPDLVLEDCYYIINEVLFNLNDLLQDLRFDDYQYRDRQGHWHSTRWKHGTCTITVGNARKSEATDLQLFKVILAANKIIKECISEQRIPQGGISKIGPPGQHFFVGILGFWGLSGANESSDLALLKPGFSRRSSPQILPSAISNLPVPDNNYNASEQNKTDTLAGPTVHPATSFPPREPTDIRPYPDPKTMLADCSYILNEIILRIDYVFDPLIFTFYEYRDPKGYRHQSRWAHGFCAIFVTSTKARSSQSLTLLEVALTANKILADCVNGVRPTQGGSSPVGPLGTQFYVGVLGESPHDLSPDNPGDVARHSAAFLVPNIDFARGLRDQQQGSKSASKSQSLSMSNRPLPSLDPTANMEVPPNDLALGNDSLSLRPATISIKGPPQYPVSCFNPYSIKWKPAVVQDCENVINEIILRYPNPMIPQTFGYTASADIDLGLPQNEKWICGQCVIFLRNMDKTRTDTFRMVDVAFTAHRILTKCVVETKYPVGGTADVGTTEDDFYVGVGGLTGMDAVNETLISLPSSDTNSSRMTGIKKS